MARPSDSSRLVRTTPNIQQERFILYRKESLIEEPSSVSDISDQLSEFDSNASEPVSQWASATHEEGAVETVPETFLYQGHSAHESRRPKKLSYRITRFHHTEVWKFITLKTCANWKYQWKGPMYRLHFISFYRNCLCWDTKNGIRDSYEKSTRFGIFVKKKREHGNQDPSHPFHTLSKLVVPYLFSREEPLILVSIS